MDGWCRDVPGSSCDLAGFGLSWQPVVISVGAQAPLPAALGSPRPQPSPERGKVARAALGKVVACLPARDCGWRSACWAGVRRAHGERVAGASRERSGERGPARPGTSLLSWEQQPGRDEQSASRWRPQRHGPANCEIPVPGVARRRSAARTRGNAVRGNCPTPSHPPPCRRASSSCSSHEHARASKPWRPASLLLKRWPSASEAPRRRRNQPSLPADPLADAELVGRTVDVAATGQQGRAGSSLGSMNTLCFCDGLGTRVVAVNVARSRFPCDADLCVWAPRLWTIGRPEPTSMGSARAHKSRRVHYRSNYMMLLASSRALLWWSALLLRYSTSSPTVARDTLPRLPWRPDAVWLANTPTIAPI